MADKQDITRAETEEIQEAHGKIGGLVGLIMSRFQEAEDHRLVKEGIWLAAYRNYRGFYAPEILQNIEADKSKAFVKITKQKVMAAYGQIIDVLFGGNKFPMGVEPTLVPDGIEEYAHAEQQTSPMAEQAISDPYGFEGDGKEIPPGATAAKLGDLAKIYGPADLKPGPAKDPSQPQIEPARIAAKNMEKVILDQLESSNCVDHIKACVFEACLLGTGVLKGPFTSYKTVHNWKTGDDGKPQYEAIQTLFPEVSAPSLWDCYPDPSARVGEDMEWHIERHKLNRSQIRKLAKQPFFNEAAIKQVILMGPNYSKKYYEHSLTDSAQQHQTEDRWEVLEYWGIMDTELADAAGIELDAKMKLLDVVQINAWICNNTILRAVINPFTPERIPYYYIPFEQDAYQIWGIGVAENIDDTQMIMNGLARMTIDNLAISGNLVFDVDENSLVAGQDLRIRPGKIFRRQSGMPGQAVYALKFPNVANETMQVFDRFRQLADEQTGMPSYSHGQTGVSGTTRTAAGMSMLMGAATLNIKTVIKNIDDYLLTPLGESMFAWNMQFNESDDLPIRGDLEIRARGTAALMQKEVRSQRLMMFMQLAANPTFAPFIKLHTIIKEVAESLDIDPEKIINNPEEAAIYARIIGLQAGAGGTDSGGEGGPGGIPANVGSSGNAPAGTSPSDTQGSGGGTIGSGAPSPSGTSSNSANAT